jgi:diphthine synthase
VPNLWKHHKETIQEENKLITLVSIGINSHQDLSLKGIQAAREADKVYAETYTMKLDTTIPELEEVIGKKITPLKRNGMEEQADQLLQEAKTCNIAILVGGDALSATTHISLLLDAREDGVETKVIHGSSIFTSITDTGLSLYKFGKTVTIPLPEKGPVDTAIRTVKENYENGLHTLILLDLNMAEEKYLTIPHAIQRLIDTGEFNPETLLVGAARLGSRFPTIKADTAQELLHIDFGEPPHTIIAPGKLHFMEEEALESLADCPRKVIQNHNPVGETDRLITKYSVGCRRVLDELETRHLPVEITLEQVQELLKHTENYLYDAEYYRVDKKATALTCVAYAEGILDALKLLGVVDFEW